MCGCGKKSTNQSQRRAAVVPPRTPNTPINKVVFPAVSNNIKPMKMAPISLPASNEAKDVELRRLKKMHQEARLRSLGKI